MGKLKGRRKPVIGLFDGLTIDIGRSTFLPFLLFFFCRGNPPRLGNEGIFGGLTMRNSRLIEEGIRGKQDGVFFYGFIFQLIDMYLTSEKLEFYIGCNRDK